MDDIDLDGVDPARRFAIRARVQVLRRYFALVAPTKADEEMFAAELGIRRMQFQNLAKAWNEYGRASALPGARRRSRVSRPARITPTAESAIEEAIRRAPEGTVAEIARIAGDLANGRGEEPPGWLAVSRRVEAARALLAATVKPTRTIVVGRCATDMRTTSRSGGVVPIVLALALWVDDTSILSAVAGTADNPPGLRDAVVELMRMSDADAPPARVQVLASPRAERAALAGAVGAAGMGHLFDWTAPASAPLATPQSILGSMLGPSRLTTFRRKAEWATPRHFDADLARPLDAAEIHATIRSLVDVHNRAIWDNAAPRFSLGERIDRELFRRLASKS